MVGAQRFTVPFSLVSQQFTGTPTWGVGGEQEYSRALMRLMTHFGMLEGERRSGRNTRAFVEPEGHGVGNMASHNLAPCDGLLRPVVDGWDHVDEGDLLGVLSDLYGDIQAEICARRCGLVIALPLLQYVSAGSQCGIVV